MDKISIVVPVYNAEAFISETLDSIIVQSYSNFEVLCVDDQSTDGTIDIIKKYMDKDERIKLFILDQKGGASLARNRALEEATGKYIAFLDSDDVWQSKKLEKQVNFMKENGYDFTYSFFGFIDEKSEILNHYRISPSKISYKTLLRGNTIGCLTVMYDSESIGLVQIPRIDKRNDFALWLEVLKNTERGYLLPETLSYYRVSDNSLSRKDGKINLIKYHVQLHRQLQGFGWLKTIYYTVFNILITVIISKKYTRNEGKNV